MTAVESKPVNVIDSARNSGAPVTFFARYPLGILTYAVSGVGLCLTGTLDIKRVCTQRGVT